MPKSGRSTSARRAVRVGAVIALASLLRPWDRLRGAPVDREVAVGRDRDPRPHLAARPRAPDLRAAGSAQAEVDPAQLAARVAATDRHLVLDRPVAGLHLDPRPDRVA